MPETEDGPGLAAIRAHVQAVDGGAPDGRLTPRNPSRFGGRGGPLHTVDSHALDSPRHWHLVTYGLSELFGKESDDPGTSGWGFELTLRVPRADGEEAAPAWASDLVTNLAAYVWQSGHDFAYGDHIDLRGPIRLGTHSALTAAALAVDPTLGSLSGPFGLVQFLQVVGLTADELELCRAWRTEAVLDLLAGAFPLLLTDPDRVSLLDDPAMRERAEAGIAAEGRAIDELAVGLLRWRARGRGKRRVVVQLGAGTATALGPALRRRLTGPGATFGVVGDGGRLAFAVGAAPRWHESPGEVRVEVPLDAVDDLAGLFTGQVGSFALASLPGLHFVALP